MNKFKALSIIVLLAAGPALAQTAAPQRLTPADSTPGKTTATVDLGAEFAQMKGFTLNQSVATVAPGTGRAMHSHAGAPEIVRILSGVLTDSRNGGPPTAYGPGSTLINAQGTQHMWANLGTEPVVFVATSIRAVK